MERSKKDKRKLALILNALVLPGLGHFYIGQKLKGVFLVIATLFFFATPLVKYTMLVSKMLAFVASLNNPNMLANLYQASALVWPNVKTILYISIIGLLAVWIYGIWDIWRVKRS